MEPRLLVGSLEAEASIICCSPEVTMTSLGSDGVAFVDLWPQGRTHTKANKQKAKTVVFEVVVKGNSVPMKPCMCNGIHTVQTACASSKTTAKAEPLPWDCKPIAAGTLRAFLLF